MPGEQKKGRVHKVPAGTMCPQRTTESPSATSGKKASTAPGKQILGTRWGLNTRMFTQMLSGGLRSTPVRVPGDDHEIEPDD